MTSVKINFIGLKVSNPNLAVLLNKLRMEYFDYIDIPKCTEMGLTSGVELEPHITIIYNESLVKGPNWYHWFVSVKNRDLFKKLINPSDLMVRVPKAILNTFDNGSSKVLKFDMNECDKIDVLTDLHYRLEESAPEKCKFPKYQAHITLTYLRGDTPQEVIDHLKSQLILSNYTDWKIEGLIYSGDVKKIFNYDSDYTESKYT